MKVRGDYFNSLLDTDDGVFHNKEMLVRLLKTSPHGEVVSAGGGNTGRRVLARPVLLFASTCRMRKGLFCSEKPLGSALCLDRFWGIEMRKVY